MEQNTIYELLQTKMNEAPDALAVFDENRRLTRAELNQLIDTIDSKLPPHVQKAGIIMEHSVEMIAAIFAVLKRGGAYIPVEPFFPQERVDFMMQDAGAEVIIAGSTYAEKASELPCIIIDSGIQAEKISTACMAKPDSLAYILYTSGSTGIPKGVAVRNRNVCHYVRAFSE